MEAGSPAIVSEIVAVFCSHRDFSKTAAKPRHYWLRSFSRRRHPAGIFRSAIRRKIQIYIYINKLNFTDPIEIVAFTVIH